MGHKDPDPYASMIKAVSWLMTMLAACFVATRFLTKWSMTRRWTVDDTMIVFAVVFSFTQSIILTVAVSYGYATQADLDIDSNPNLSIQEKLIYASNIMFFLSTGSSMLSTSQLLLNLSPQISHRIVSWSISSVTIVWTLVAIFAFAFQCGLPNTWDFVNGQCYHQKTLYTIIASANLVIELGLILQPAIVIWHLQLARRHKVKIIACFCGRSIVAVGLVGLIVTFWLSGSNGETMLFYGVTLSTVLVDNLSIMAASVPYLKPFLQGLEHSMTRIEMAQPPADPEEGCILGSSNHISKIAKATVTTTQIRAIQDLEDSEGEESIPKPKTFHSNRQSILGEIRTAGTHDFRGGIMHTSEYTVESYPVEVMDVYNSKL